MQLLLPKRNPRLPSALGQEGASAFVAQRHDRAIPLRGDFAPWPRRERGSRSRSIQKRTQTSSPRPHTPPAKARRAELAANTSCGSRTSLGHRPLSGTPAALKLPSRGGKTSPSILSPLEEEDRLAASELQIGSPRLRQLRCRRRAKSSRLNRGQITRLPPG